MPPVFPRPLLVRRLCSPAWPCSGKRDTANSVRFIQDLFKEELTINDSDNASRYCFPNGTWAGLTNYSSCKLLEETASEFEHKEVSSDLEISIVIYLVGKNSSLYHVLSLFVL